MAVQIQSSFYRGLDDEIERRWMPAINIRADEGEGDDAGPVLRGHANTYDEYLLEYWNVREVLRPGAMSKTLAEKADIRALLNHNPDKVLGRTAAGTLMVRDEEIGLYSEIYPDLEISHAADTYRMIKRGDITQMSYAFRAVKERWTFYDDDDTPALRELLEIELFDVSPVTYPANPGTDISIGKRSLEYIEDRALEGVKQAQRMLRRMTEMGSYEPRQDSLKPPDQALEPNDGLHSEDKGKGHNDEILRGLVAQKVLAMEIGGQS